MSEIQENPEPDWNSLYNDINPALFTMFDGRPIVFHFRIDHSDQKTKWEKLVQLGGGHFVSTFSEMDSYTALMVEDLSAKVMYTRPSFKTSYITDCIEQNALLDISDFLHNDFYKKSNHYMNVLFYGKEEFEDDSCCKSISSYASEAVNINLNKHTREPYTLYEKEAILKFILSRPGRPGNLSGDTLWKTMEKRNICPRRSYQSLKNHFRRTLLNELDRFEFLTEGDKKYLRGEGSKW